MINQTIKDKKLEQLASLLRERGVRTHININDFGYSQIERDIVDLLLSPLDWISVKERLPENDDTRCCMVCYNQTLSGDVVGIGRAWAWLVDDATDAIGNKISYFKEYYGDDLISNVTHWMPIPPPPVST